MRCHLLCSSSSSLRFFFFNDTATTEIYTLSLHDALPISEDDTSVSETRKSAFIDLGLDSVVNQGDTSASLVFTNIERSEEHTSELQSRLHLVCRLLLEKKKKRTVTNRRKQEPEHALIESN